jgi:hypothetical protein
MTHPARWMGGMRHPALSLDGRHLFFEIFQAGTPFPNFNFSLTLFQKKTPGKRDMQAWNIGGKLVWAQNRQPCGRDLHMDQSRPGSRFAG